MKLDLITLVGLCSLAVSVASRVGPRYLPQPVQLGLSQRSLSERDGYRLVARGIANADHGRSAVLPRTQEADSRLIGLHDMTQTLLYRRGAPTLPKQNGPKPPPTPAQKNSYLNKGGLNSDSKWRPEVRGDVSKDTLKCTSAHICSGEIVA